MPRTARLILQFSAYCLIMGLFAPAHGQTTSDIPKYFFKEWTISKDCSQPHAGTSGHVKKSLKFRISPAATKDGTTYSLEALDAGDMKWPGGWKTVQLEYRAGTKMTAVPADFECIPGEEASSPFLAMTNYSQISEPWYEYEHWYGLVDIHGERHHVLIFPRDVNGTSSAIILLQDTTSSDNVTLNHNGSIHSDG